ncbi:protein NRT1/ PTR FAMILY 8.2-like [Triticum dicoccoides]|uniref:protein NRT1/ PTR FAMILY 8.2-like n=1 Tax=Triticum dicoccoides TaxID=85692 RepID=UPI000E79E042|nr:protein NRT1/ PTR FAMILY 8.2-like [Triticum dicoccoides]XP_037407647.1 protein NRT1/ PTR FAMILY 8.2-like [Triticum dicoccoides]
MEAVQVESKGSHGGDETSSSKKKKDRRSSWGCAFLLVNNCFQYTAYFGVSTNLVNYLKVQLHSGSKAAANSVTNWQGTASITPLAAAFLADSFLGRYWTITVFLLISVAGYGVVTASASAALESAVLFYAGLYLVALGGALQPVLSSFGADQFDVEADEEERGRQSSFFNWFYLTINVGSLVGGTVLVWVQSAHGWRLGYGIPALLSVVAVALFLAGTGAYRSHQPPGGSPLTRIAQVVVAAARKCDVEAPTDAALLHELDGDDGMSAILGSRRLAHTDQFRFLDKAAAETADDKARPASPWRLCTVTQVEELKCVLRLLPVWACGIIFAAAYTQMTTTFILQGDTLDPRVGSFRVPPAVLTVFDTLSVMLWVPLYDRAVVPLARRLTGHHRGFTQLARMGVGFVILTVAMLAAGTLEVARRRVVTRHGTYTGEDGAGYVPMSIFWQVPQYVVVGAAEVFTFIGQMEFFYDQAPDAMRSVCSGLSSAAFALGNYASSALVAVVVRATTRGGRPGWIPDDINDRHLDYFFWLLAMLCIGNFGAYLLVARWYIYKKTAD